MKKRSIRAILCSFVCLALLLPASVYAAPDISDIMNAEGLPILKQDAQMAEITMFIAANPLLPEELNDTMWVKYAAEKTGITFDWLKNPSEGALEKANLLLASGDYPDVFWNTIDASVISQYIDSGIFIPTQDLVEQYMPNLKKIFEERPEYKAMCTAPDGNMYGFPYIEEMKGLVNTPGAMIINKDWLDQLGLPVPTTLDELADAMRAMKGKDLNGNGLDDEYPMAFNFMQNGDFGSQNIFCSIAGCFGQGIPIVGQQDDFLTAKEGKLVYTATLDAYKDTVAWFHQMYQEGLIDPASFSPSSNPRGIIVDKMNQGVAQIGVCGTWNRMSAVPDGAVREQYVALPRLQGPQGMSGVENNFSELQLPTACAITDACEYPELVARFVDFCYAPYESIYLNWGMPEYIFVQKENGLIGYDFDENGQPNLKDGFASFADMRNFCTPVKGSLAILSDYYDTILEYPVDTMKYLLEGQITNGKYEIMDEFEALPRLFFLQEEQNTISQIVPQLKNIVSSYSAKWMMDGGVDEEWDAYLKDLNAAGLDEYLRIYQTVYDRYLASLKAAGNN